MVAGAGGRLRTGTFRPGGSKSPQPKETGRDFGMRDSGSRIFIRALKLEYRVFPHFDMRDK